MLHRSNPSTCTMKLAKHESTSKDVHGYTARTCCGRSWPVGDMAVDQEGATTILRPRRARCKAFNHPSKAYVEYSCMYTTRVSQSKKPYKK